MTAQRTVGPCNQMSFC